MKYLTFLALTVCLLFAVNVFAADRGLIRARDYEWANDPMSVQAGWVDTRYSDFLEGTYDAEIYVSRRLQEETSPGDSGCIEYHARFDVNNDGWYDLISPAAWGPLLKIWLGSSTGYSASNYLAYSITDGGDCDVSDLNLDGYSELIHSGYMSGQTCIYWGTPGGPSQDDTTLLPNNQGEAVYVADFDKDTYLDIAIGGVWSTFYVYWGSAAGYSTSDRFALSLGPMAHNLEASDLDMNGYLDAIAIRYDNPYNDVVILYQTDKRFFVPVPLDFSTVLSPHGLSIGDLDNNGYTDIVATGYLNMTFSSIYWGRSSGYNSADRLNVNPGECYGGSAVADFDDDGWLDILYYRKGGRRPMIYYNMGSPPFFSDANTKEIGPLMDATAGTVADFNYDGYVDVFVNNRSSYSYVLYGPSFTTYDVLPINYDHHGMFREPRQIPSYYSKVVRPCSLGTDTLVLGGKVSWVAYTPGGSVINMLFRVGDTSIPDSSWTEWYQVETDTNFGELPDEVCEGHKYIQYRADLFWDSPAELPNLERVEVDLRCGDVDTLCDPVEPWAVRTQGYWRRQCKDDAHDDICAYVDSIYGLADLFDAFDCDSICDLMKVDPPENDMCRKARRQFMALLLNVSSGKVAVCNCLEDGGEVGDVMAEIDSLLSGDPVHATCVRAKTLADDINKGVSLVPCDSFFAPLPPKAILPVSSSSAPNPFINRATIYYELSVAQDVELKVYDRMGRFVRVLVDAEQNPGPYEVEWDGLDRTGREVPTGTYFYRLEVESSAATGKLIFIR